jgi:MoxR-like ATPase
MKPAFKAHYGSYKLPGEAPPVSVVSTTEPAGDVTTVNLIATNSFKQDLVPAKFEGFVEWGHFATLNKVVKSGMFYPVFVTGLSGNGKTLMVEEIHAKLGKELIRVNITIETDEDDLLGGFRLVNGETKFMPGPVIEAMERGCTLLLDECDLGSNKLLALQPVLEGKGVYLKKVNKWIIPKDGFNVIATANTKGKGSEDGRFIGTNILNEAFLERFAITLEQPYATATTEKKIVLGSMKKYGVVDEDFATNLVTWAEVIRKTFYDGGVDEVISTRRLDHIVKAVAIFGDKMKSIELCVARFDGDTKDSFLDLYTKIDAGLLETEEEKAKEAEELLLDENDML